MSAVALLLGLLVVAYVGSHLMGSRGDGLRLASGAEYLLLGVALGPYALGAVERATLFAFQPIAVIGTAWITLVIGVGYGFRDGRRVSFRGMVTGIFVGALSGASQFAAYALLDGFLPVASGPSPCAGSSRARRAVRRALGRHPSRRRRSSLPAHRRGRRVRRSHPLSASRGCFLWSTRPPWRRICRSGAGSR
jgi:hypothetical protein